MGQARREPAKPGQQGKDAVLKRRAQTLHLSAVDETDALMRFIHVRLNILMIGITIMRRYVISLLSLGLAIPAVGQVALPPVGQTIGPLTGALDQKIDDVTGLDALRLVRSATQLARNRIERLGLFVRDHSDRIERDEEGQPARKGVVLLLNADEAALDVAGRLGFLKTTETHFGNLGLGATELTVPPGMSLRRAVSSLRKALPDKTITADQIYFQASAHRSGSATAHKTTAFTPIKTAVGIIDGGVASAVGPVEGKSFAKGGFVASDHGTAIASLLLFAGVRHIYAADVYGDDPAGGNAFAIVRALNWLAGEKVPVISMSLVGPRNPIMEQAIANLTKRGTTIVAAVGNDGPAAPPAFPASYSQVIAVTGVDGHDRALIEAGRAMHLDYAGPGADIAAPDRNGRRRSLRGTSYAAPLVAARAAAIYDRGVSRENLKSLLDKEALDLGRRGPDTQFGRGLLCGDCRPQ